MDGGDLPRPPDGASGCFGRRALHGIGVAAVAAGQRRFRAPAHGLLLEFVSIGDGDGRAGRAVRGDGGGWCGWGWCRSIQTVEGMAEVGHEASAEGDIDTGCGGQSDGHFAGALGESSAEAIASDDWVGR